MKKWVTWLTVFLCVLGLTGCGQHTYRLSRKQFCYSATGSAVPELPPEEQEYIVGLMNKATWKTDCGNCDSQHIFSTKGREVSYHALCGTFHDLKSKQSAALTPEQRTKVNNLLGITDPKAFQNAPGKEYKVKIGRNANIISQLKSTYAPGEPVTVTLAPVTEYCNHGYINGVLQHTQQDEHGQKYFTFIMPCEDVLIETRLSGSWGYRPFH